MPVSTRSMTRRELQPGSVPSDVRLTCNDMAILVSKNSSSSMSMHLDFKPPDLIDQCHLSTSSSECELSSSSMCGNPTSLSSNDNFENFEFEILKPSTVTPRLSSAHNLELSQFSIMESDCKDTNNPSTKDESYQLQQENIIHMLGAISSKMMSNLQSLQDQMIKMDEKLTKELQLMVQNNEKFKQDVRAELASSHSVSLCEVTQYALRCFVDRLRVSSSGSSLVVPEHIKYGFCGSVD
jgi:hypothetical protein